MTAFASLIALVVVAACVFLVALLAAAETSLRLLPRATRPPPRRDRRRAGARALDAARRARPGRLLAPRALVVGVAFARPSARHRRGRWRRVPGAARLWADALLGLARRRRSCSSRSARRCRARSPSATPSASALAAAPLDAARRGASRTRSRALLSAPFVWAASLSRPRGAARRARG